MKRTASDIVRAFARKLSDGDLEFVRTRLIERLSGDWANCLDFLQKNIEMDRLILSAIDVGEFYKIMDMIEEAVVAEVGRRSHGHSRYENHFNR